MQLSFVSKNPERGIVSPEDHRSMLATIELMSDPGYHRAMAAVQADLAGGDTAWVSHDEVERRLSERFSGGGMTDVGRTDLG